MQNNIIIKVKDVHTLAPGCRHAIIYHSGHGGSLYLREAKNSECEAFGLWSQGCIARVKDDDTLTSLADKEWDADHGVHLASVMDIMLLGHDTERPLLNWSGHMIATVAKAAGL